MKTAHFKSIPFIFTKEMPSPQNQTNSKSLPIRIPLFTPFRKKCFPPLTPFCLRFVLTNDRLHLRCFDAQVYIEVIKAYIHLSSSQKYQNQYINKRMPDTQRFSMLLHKCCPDYNMYEILNSFLH